MALAVAFAAALALGLWALVPQRPAPVPAAPADPAVALAVRQGAAVMETQYCLRCHGMELTKVGPGFAQIAQRYRGDPGAPAQLAERIQHGSAGRWGRKLMPRQLGISPEQARVLAAWVLAQPDPVSR